MDKLLLAGDPRPVLISRSEAKYTDEARERRIQGDVLLRAYVDEAGVVTQAEVLKPLGYGLDLAALEAVAQWRFRPATEREYGEVRPVGTWVHLQIDFRLL